jgi:hypothetical protein
MTRRGIIFAALLIMSMGTVGACATKGAPAVACDEDILKVPHEAKDMMGLKCPDGGTVLIGDKGGLEKWCNEKGGGKASWDYADGAATVKPGTGSMITKEKYGDMRLHVEFCIPEGGAGQGAGNSGVYIQQRYEVQILNSFGKKKLEANECGGLYKFKAADANACRKPGEWQVYDIWFYAAKYEGSKKVKNARVTVIQNGKFIHKDVELSNKTGAGKKEGPEKMPLRLQDHGNPVKFRNVWIVAIEK